MQAMVQAFQSLGYQSGIASPTKDTATAHSAMTHVQMHTVHQGTCELWLLPPERDLGEPSSCHAFLVLCTLVLELQPSTSPTEWAKVAYVITLLGGKA